VFSAAVAGYGKAVSIGCIGACRSQFSKRLYQRLFVLALQHQYSAQSVLPASSFLKPWFYHLAFRPGLF